MSMSIQGKGEEQGEDGQYHRSWQKEQENDMQAYFTLQVIWLFPVGQQWVGIDRDLMAGAKWLVPY